MLLRNFGIRLPDYTTPQHRMQTFVLPTVGTGRHLRPHILSSVLEKIKIEINTKDQNYF
jgi:hypothetical protein